MWHFCVEVVFIVWRCTAFIAGFTSNTYSRSCTTYDGNELLGFAKCVCSERSTRICWTIALHFSKKAAKIHCATYFAIISTNAKETPAIEQIKKKKQNEKKNIQSFLKRTESWQFIMDSLFQCKNSDEKGDEEKKTEKCLQNNSNNENIQTIHYYLYGSVQQIF